MKNGEGFKGSVQRAELDPQRRLRLLAFHDFCCDLLEEEFGEVSQWEETDPRFVKNLLTRRKDIPSL